MTVTRVPDDPAVRDLRLDKSTDFAIILQMLDSNDNPYDDISGFSFSAYAKNNGSTAILSDVLDLNPVEYDGPNAKVKLTVALAIAAAIPGECDDLNRANWPDWSIVVTDLSGVASKKIEGKLFVHSTPSP